MQCKGTAARVYTDGSEASAGAPPEAPSRLHVRHVAEQYADLKAWVGTQTHLLLHDLLSIAVPVQR